jgi:hypothetical protein
MAPIRNPEHAVRRLYAALLMLLWIRRANAEPDYGMNMALPTTRMDVHA